MKSIVIVGGGTSGWMAAIALSTHFPDKRITVIDPTAIGPIGVGESVTGAVQMFVNHPPHGLSFSEFYREADATPKLGIWYKDWQGPNREYLTPIDAPSKFFDHHYDQDIEDFARVTAQRESIGEIQTHGRLMRANKTDYYRAADGQVSGNLSMASCHVDALKFAAWLKRICCQRSNVTHVDDVVQRFEQEADSGMVTEIVTGQGKVIEGDFFLDCTGFHRLLLEKAFAPQWQDLSNYLKVDRAIPCTTDYAEGEPIPVYSTARAMPNGWMWQIPTQARLGHGYVFSSRHVSDEQAISEMKAAGVDPGVTPQVLRFRPGKFTSLWQKNVCAIGMAGGFLEPLEATTIHIMHVQIKLLTELFLPFYTREASASLSRRFDAMMDTMYEDFVDFVGFHYHTGRDDTEFWRDYQKRDSITDNNQARIEMWKHAYPLREDFAGVFTHKAFLTTSILVWMPMLCGMGHLDRHHATTWIGRSLRSEIAQQNAAKYVQYRNQICNHAVGPEEAIRYLCKEKE